MDSLLAQAAAAPPAPALSAPEAAPEQPRKRPALEEEQAPAEELFDPARELSKASDWLKIGRQISFRRLHQLADEVAGRISHVDDAGAAATVETLAMVPTVQAVVYDDSDLVRLHRLKTYVPEHLQHTQSRKRKLCKLPSETPPLSAQETKVLHPVHLTQWEDDVVWGDEEEASEDSEERGRKTWNSGFDDDSWPISNPLMERGLWTKGIIWDPDEVLDDSEDEWTAWQLRQNARGWPQPIGDNLPPASVIYGYYDPVPLWIDINDPNIHVMEDRGGAIRYMGEEEEEEEEEEEQPEPAEPARPELTQEGAAPPAAAAAATAAAGAAATAAAAAAAAATAAAAPQERPEEAGPAAYSKREKERLLRAQKIQRLRGITAAFDVTASIAGGKRTDDDELRRRRVIAAPAVDHSTYATRHPQPVDLHPRKLKLFHRPRNALHSQSWSLVRPRGISNLFAGRSRNFRGGELLPQMSKGEDLLPIKGDFIVVEYVEEFLPIVTNAGMGSRIINYYRSTEANEDKDELGRDASNNRRRARLPRHLQRLQNRENDANDRLVPKFPEGQTVVLEPTDESPFLGDIPPGETQPCLSNNLYRVPLFEQRTLGNDFLLIRDALPREKGEGAEAASKRSRYRCYVREMPRVYLAGQQEPQKAVPFPSKKTTAFQHEWIRLHIARYLKRVGAQLVTLYELQQRLFKSTYFPSAAIRKVMRELADGPDQHAHYQKKPDAQFPNIDELEKQISVEEVCLYECSAAGEKQLESYGIQEMRSPTIVANALDRLVTLHRIRKQRAEQARTAARQLKNTPRGTQAEKLAEVLERDAARTDRMIKIARFIHEKLLLTPWNLTGEFVQGHLQAQGTGMLQLTGIGDPSGRGEAFSYLRSSRQKAKRKSNDLQAEQWMRTITGTSEDLRKLTVQEMTRRLIEMGVSPQQVKQLKRWDLVHLIREHANKAAGAGQEHALTKFARGSKLNHAAQLADYKTICNRIWGYQQAALTSLERPEDDIEGDEDEEEEDVDDWEKDMLEGLEQGRPSQGRGAAAGGEEARILEQWRQELRQDEAAKLSAQIIISSEEQKEPETRVPLIHRPKKVVKRIERVLDPTGKEKVTIRFILDSALVEEVEENRRQKRLQLAKDAVRQRRRQQGFDDDHIKSHRYSSGGSLQLGLLRRKAGVDAPEQDAEADAFTNVQQRGRSRRPADSAPSRLPQASLAVLLEDIWLTLWEKNAAAAFRLPVDTRKYPDYLTKVKTPIDLSTIRNKIAGLEYTSLQGFLDDLQLMVQNSITYNGPKHPVTLDAQSLLTLAQGLADTPVNKEQFRHFERELAAKNAALHRTPRSIAIPSVAKAAPAPASAVAAPAPAAAPATSTAALAAQRSAAATPTISSLPSAVGTPMTERSAFTPQSLATATPSLSQVALGQDTASEPRETGAVPSTERIADIFAALDSDSDEESGEEEEDEANTQGDVLPTQDTDRGSDVTSYTARFLATQDEDSKMAASSEDNGDVASQPMDIEFSQPLRPASTIPDDDESSGEEEVLEEG